jgi:hypothetical protein
LPEHGLLTIAMIVQLNRKISEGNENKWAIEEVSEIDRLNSFRLAPVSGRQNGSITYAEGNNAAYQPLFSVIDSISQYTSDKSALIRGFCEFVD